ncbi:MAG: deoxyribodipyrimidine photo-lyase [Acetobacteraceae bacterium]
MARSMVLFRDDLRLADHPALSKACKDKRDIICLLMLDKGSKIRPMGGAARWWLHDAIASLRASLRQHHGDLLIVEGDAREIVPHLARHFEISDVYAHYRYGPAERDIDASIGKALGRDDIGFHQYHAAVLCPPENIKNGAGQAFKVFSAFWRAIADKRNRGKARFQSEIAWRDFAIYNLLHSPDMTTANLPPNSITWRGGMSRK